MNDVEDSLAEMMKMAAEASDVRKFMATVFYSSPMCSGKSCLVCGEDEVRLLYSETEGRTYACEGCYEKFINSDFSKWNDWAREEND